MRYGCDNLQARLLCGAAAAALLMVATPASAQDEAPGAKFNIAAQPLADGLNEFARQSGRPVMFTPEVTGRRMTRGATDVSDPELALNMVLAETGLTWRRSGDTFLIVSANDPQSGSAAGDGADAGTVEALIVTAQKREEDIQDVPIAISAFTQEQLTDRQVAGGPDLMTQIPNFTFTKTNFSSYSIQIRGIGTQAISATTDAAVAVAFNNTPFIRNRFFEQEFYDLQRVEVLRGPQGTLYGRNATAGVVNIISAKPSFNYEARLSGDVANYNSTRLEGMVNVPIVEDKVALRLAGAWTKREGFVTNEITGNPIDGRDLWSTRLSLRFAPTDWLDANLIWEHFEEGDDRLRSGKQLCKKDVVNNIGGTFIPYEGGGIGSNQQFFSQGCAPSSLYSAESFQTPNGYSLPYYHPLGVLSLPVVQGLDPYLSTIQSRDLRVIESTVDPHYDAETNLVELQLSVDLPGDLTIVSETGYLSDALFSTQDFNRFNTAPGAFAPYSGLRPGVLDENGVFCDPQVGCADRLVAVDLSTAESRHFSQEFRIGSNYDGPFNFSLGANFLRYDTEDKYYVFINTLTMAAAIRASIDQYDGTAMPPYVGGVSDNTECLRQGFLLPNYAEVSEVAGCSYIDPNPIGNLNDQGHNYFLSRNPYKLISYAIFGEAYYNFTENLKITAGLRWTVDKKEAPRIPSWVLGSVTPLGLVGQSASGAGYSVFEVIEQEWREPTGRLTIDWKPDLSFTDETLLYASYAHGYKAGGANPPPAGLSLYAAYSKTQFVDQSLSGSATHPKTFEPEFVDAFEVGSKNTILDGRLTLNAAAFYYDYTGYQISQIIDRSALNLNFDAKIWGVELEADWRPLENLRLGLKVGNENTRVADGERAIDIMDRTAGNPDWVVVRPFPSIPSNCVLPLITVRSTTGVVDVPGQPQGGNISGCELAYVMGLDPVTELSYVPNPTVGGPGSEFGATGVGWAGYPGFNPLDETQGHNGGAGFYKDLSGNELPNAPYLTTTITADYTVPLPSNWLMTLHTDLYYQSEAWTRIFNMEGYDKLKAYTNVNLAAIFTNEDAGWKVMAYVKNVFDRDSITGAFLNSDDTGLTTNVFLTEPRLYGLRVTKEWSGGPWWTGANPNHAGPYPLTVEIGGQVQRQDAPYETLAPGFSDEFSAAIDPTIAQNRDLDLGDGREVRVVYKPTGSTWRAAAALRYGRVNGATMGLHQDEIAGENACSLPAEMFPRLCDPTYVAGSKPPGYYYSPFYAVTPVNWSDSSAREKSEHTIVDFSVGKDVGLGFLGDVRSTLEAGLRYASFEQDTDAFMRGTTNMDLPDGWFVKYSSFDRHRASINAHREFEGVGPTLSWAASRALLGDDELGRLALDWSITGGALFGKQSTDIVGSEASGSFYVKYADPIAALPPLTETPLDMAPRSKSVTVPLVDLSLGLSYEIRRIKIGAGYRWERYFDVLDVGFEEHQDADRTIDGPYFKIAVGFGG